MAQAAMVHHSLKIQSWRLNYSFGTGKNRFCRELYSDGRHLTIRARIEQPQNIKAKIAQIRCIPYEALIAGYKEHASASHDPRPVGEVSYRGADYSAVLFMPADALPLIVPLLTAGKYSFLSIYVAKGGAVDSYSFLDYLGPEPDLAGSWDDV
ncbi:hypothetical protein [Bradyrhizobium sp. CSS354]|uniref:hypothetical protein n=1 Tax=Bradyrhizobium sp. CSS354 TaxID=2699172 RepID=UPI0023B0D521|nr:hypothetical protein [Bradyrhizobium sp. CSS354]MDE5460200.1 hypothetical protein [Bradyrhizobium sp. CSS354]